VAEWRASEPAEELVARADEALYGAKNTGRDRVVSA
jgi:PleD family two-component response regulator